MISTCILINDCILQDFKPPVDVSTEDVKRVWEMLCEYILKRPSTERASSTVVHCEFIVTRNLKLIQSSLVRCCYLRNLLGLLGWGQILPGSVRFLMTPFKQALMRVT
jgi:hypothetical protein